jgi:acyl-CoA synthetase (AMP-forming)/AMP-acid ligase II
MHILSAHHTMIDTTKPQVPSLDETQFLVDVLDFHHRNNATRPYAVWSSSSGVVSLSWLEYARGTHRLAKIFSSATPGSREVVALLLVCDTLMYTSTILGLLRAGFSVSP